MFLLPKLLVDRIIGTKIIVYDLSAMFFLNLENSIEHVVQRVIVPMHICLHIVFYQSTRESLVIIAP